MRSPFCSLPEGSPHPKCAIRGRCAVAPGDPESGGESGERSRRPRSGGCLAHEAKSCFLPLALKELLTCCAG